MRPILITDDPEILDHSLRVAAAVGIEVELVPDAGAGRTRWSAGSLVLVGADVVPALLLAAPIRRSGVIIVTTHEPEAALWQRAVSLGAEHVVVLPDADRWLAARFADVQQGPTRDGLVVGVRGAHGGAGTSTIAAGISLVAARNGLRTLLIDGDSNAGGIDVLLGAEDERGMRWPDLMASRGRIAPADLDDALLHVNGVSLLSWDRGPLLDFDTEAVDAVMTAAKRGFDLTVVDLGRGLEPCLDAHVRATVLLVAASVQSVAGAHRLLKSPTRLVEPVHVVIRGSSADAELIAESLGCAVAAVCPDESEVRRAANDGEVPAMRRRGSLTAACSRLVDALLPQAQAA